jgi:hypothetical protein
MVFPVPSCIDESQTTMLSLLTCGYHKFCGATPIAPSMNLDPIESWLWMSISLKGNRFEKKALLELLSPDKSAYKLILIKQKEGQTDRRAGFKIATSVELHCVVWERDHRLGWKASQWIWAIAGEQLFYLVIVEKSPFSCDEKTCCCDCSNRYPDANDNETYSPNLFHIHRFTSCFVVEATREFCRWQHMCNCSLLHIQHRCRSESRLHQAQHWFAS